MTEKTNIQETKPAKKKFSWKKLTVALSIIVLLMGAVQYVGYYCAVPLLKERICNSVNKKSKGLYTMDFSDLKINFIGQEIILEDFQLKADTSVYLHRIDNEQYNKAIYNISVDRLEIKHIGLKSFFSKNELYIKAIDMTSPVIRLVGKPDKSKGGKAKYDAVHTDLYPLLKPYFHSLNIRKIGITGGYFDFHMRIQDREEQFGVSKIDITLRNFYLDEDKFLKRNQFFYSDIIELGSNNYVINMADSIHRLTAERLEISTIDSSIHASNVCMTSDKSRYKQKNKFDISLKEISIDGLDISRAYFNKEVSLSNVTIKEPTIKFYQGGKVNKATKKFEASQDGWYSLIRGTLRSISIDSMQIDGAQLSLYKPLINSKPIYNVGNVNILMQGFMLDSLAHRNRNKILYSSDLTVILNDYHMLLPDNRHQLTAENLMVSTKTQIVHADKIKIRPTRYAKDSTEKTMNISIPLLEISGMDMKKAYNTRDFEIGALKIQNPKINTTSYIDSVQVQNAQEGTHTRPKAKLLTALSEEYFHSLKISSLSIYKGLVDITSKAYIKQDSLTLSGKLSLHIGSFTVNASTLKDDMIPFRTSSVTINLEDAIVKPSRSLHTLRCKNFMVDTRHDNITINHLSYTAKSDTSLIQQLRRLGKHSIMDIRISKTEFTQAELIEAIYHGRLSIENLKISNPQFQMSIYPQLKAAKDTLPADTLLIVDSAAIAIQDSLLSRYSNLEQIAVRAMPKELSLIKIDTLSADSSVVKLLIKDTLNNITTGTSSDFRLNVNGFYYNRDSISPNASIMLANGYILYINNFQFMLPDKTHIVRTGSININTYEGLIKSNVITIAPLDTAPAHGKRQITAYCPELKITGADFATFNKTGILPMDSCSINNSVAMVITPGNTPSTIAPRQDTAARRPRIFSGLVANALSSISNKVTVRREDGTPVMNLGFDFKCKNLSVDSSNIDRNKHFVSFDSTYLNADNFLMRINDNELTIRSIHQEGDTLRIIQPSFHNPADSIRNHYGASMVEIIKPDYEKAAFERTINAHAIHIHNPMAYLLTGQNKKKSARATSSDGRPPISIIIDTLSANGARIHLDRRLKNKPDLDFPNMDLLAVGINTGTDHESAWPADKITAGISNFTYKLRDTVMRFHFGRVELDPIHQVFTANQVDYRPCVGRYDYYKLYGTRRSANFLNCKKMVGYGFNIIDFVKTMKMDVSRLDVDGFAFLSYDNKTMPLDSTGKPNLHKYIFTKLPIKMKADTTVVRNAFFEIEQLTPEVGTPGVLTLNNINGRAYNFTNDTADLGKNDKMRVMAIGKLMNQSKVYANIMYDLDSPTDEFICNFWADSIYLPVLNPYLENGIFAKVDDGILTHGEVQFKSDNKESRGQSLLLYHDLKFSLNKKDSIQEKRRGLLSFLANTVLRTKNTKKTGYIYTRPDTTKSFAGYWMSSLLSGAKSTVGFETKEQKDDRKFARKFTRKIIDAVIRKKARESYMLEKPKEEDL